MADKYKYIHDYCTGCGLCKSLYGIELKEDVDGFAYPDEVEINGEKLVRICPAGGKTSEYLSHADIWGKNAEVMLGWATKTEIRKAASSGGVITALCCYLLETKKVDGIIQTIADGAYGTRTVISRDTDEVLKCMGSRYSISAPLTSIKQDIKADEKYAFVGKPCDVSALRMYLREDTVLAKQIVVLLSFFCAGTPSNSAQKILLSELGCNTPDECLSLQYRGDGWPGYATAVLKNGNINKMTYNDSWGRILGRDVKLSCRFCLDGVGELADISCGDAWFLGNDNKPDFSEGDGRNVIFARTELGLKLLQDASEKGYICADKYDNYKEELKLIQKYQYERRASMHAMVSAMRLLGRTYPHYDKKILSYYSKHLCLKSRFKRFAGTVKRIINKKI